MKNLFLNLDFSGFTEAQNLHFFKYFSGEPRERIWFIKKGKGRIYCDKGGINGK